MNESSRSTDRSHAMFEEAERVLPGGVNGNIKFRNPYPVFLSHANGSHLWDIDGNEYVDYVLSYGALILGHGHPVIREALERIIDSYGTTLFGNPSPQEAEFAEILLDRYMKGGKLRFTNSGLEATLLANRLAMAKTGKRKIAKFDGHYHGANPFLLANYRPKKRGKTGRVEKEPDSSEVKGGLLDNIVVLPFNDTEGTRTILEEEEVSSIIMEPFEDGYIPARPDFVQFLRKYTRDNGIILAFDEVKTGFRIRLGGAAEYYGIRPDLVCLGKIIGGGAPIGAVMGEPDIMDALDPRTSHDKRVFHSGTFNGNPISMTLGMATVSELASNDNFSRITRRATELRNGLSHTLEQFGIPHRTYGEGGVVNFTISEDEISTFRDISEVNMNKRRVIDNGLLKEGVYVIPTSRYMLSVAHSEEDIDRTVESLETALKDPSANSVLSD